MAIAVSAAGDFSVANDYAPIYFELQRLWNQNQAGNQPEAPFGLMKSVIENQGMRTVPHLDQQGKCLGWRLWWVRDCDDAVAYKGATFNPAITCDLPAGKQDQLVTEDFVENCFISEGRSLTDQDCDNRLFGINRSADRINAGIRAVRKSLAESIATFLTANAQVNSFADTYGTIVGTQTQFTAAEFGDLKLLYHLQLTAMKNKLGANAQMVNGVNFWETAMAANDGSCCGDEGDKVRLGKYQLTWDMHLDDFLGRQSTLMFNPSQIGFTNNPRFENDAPELKYNTNDGGQVWGWRVEDPIYNYLKIDEQGRTILTPLVYDIEYKKICIGRDSRGNIKYEHTFWVHFNGGTYLSPVACYGGSGVLEFVNV